MFGEAQGVWFPTGGSHRSLAEPWLIPEPQGKAEPGWLPVGRAGQRGRAPSLSGKTLLPHLGSRQRGNAVEMVICTNAFAFQSLSLPFSYQWKQGVIVHIARKNPFYSQGCKLIDSAQEKDLGTVTTSSLRAFSWWMGLIKNANKILGGLREWKG